MSINVGIGLSKDHDPVKAAREAFAQANAALESARTTVALMFSTLDIACPSLVRTAYALSNGTPLIGSTAPGILTSQGIMDHGLAVVLLSLPNDVITNIACVRELKAKTPTSAGEEYADKLLVNLSGVRRDTSFLLYGGDLEAFPPFLFGLKEKLGRGFPLLCGCIAHSKHAARSYVYYNQDILEHACIGMMWGGRLNYGSGVKHGWRPLGKLRTITRAAGNVIYEIDDTAALQVYQGYVGKTTAQLKKDLKNISLFYPLGILHPNDKNYVLRNIVSVDDNGALICEGDVPQDTQMRIMIATRASCLEATQACVRQSLSHIKHVPGDIRKAEMSEFSFLLNSLNRRRILGRSLLQEMELIKTEYARTPWIGINTFAEAAPLSVGRYSSQTQIHNHSIAALTLSG